MLLEVLVFDNAIGSNGGMAPHHFPQSLSKFLKLVQYCDKTTFARQNCGHAHFLVAKDASKDRHNGYGQSASHMAAFKRTQLENSTWNNTNGFDLNKGY